jgi:hypothetical protein
MTLAATIRGKACQPQQRHHAGSSLDRSILQIEQPLQGIEQTLW